MTDNHKAYLQVEGVNIGAAIFDTHQLSIARGGSLLLKQAIETLHLKFAELKPISTGASSGIFGLAQADQGVVGRIAKHLSTHNDYRHLTFVVAYTDEGDFQKAKEILFAKNRRAQLRQLSAAPDPADSGDPVPCAIEGIRRAVRAFAMAGDENDGKKDIKRSESCIARFKYGRRYRSKLYRQELGALMRSRLKHNAGGLPPELLATFTQLRHSHFSQSFEDIAKNPAYGNLNQKLAVIYFDGNGFGNIQRELVKDAKTQQQFDEQVKTLRRGFLAKLLERWLGHEKEGIIRLEALLWGGDEMLFVVPAWCGFEFMRLFYAISQDWEITLGGKTRKLTHAGGLVFCSYKTPIARMTELAKKLADRVKDQPGGRTGNFFDYIALESVDYPAEPLDRFFDQIYGKHMSQVRRPLQLPLSGGDDAKALSELRDVLKDLPRSQIFQLARLVASLPPDQPDKPEIVKKRQIIRQDFIDQTSRLEKLYPQEDSPFAKIPGLLHQLAGLPDASPPTDNNPLLAAPGTDEKSANLKPTDLNSDTFNQVAWRWLHLAECWDYLAPVDSTKKGNGHA